jgi:hypothetical protein
VHGAPGQRAQHEDVEGALQQVELMRGHDTIIPSTFDSIKC